MYFHSETLEPIGETASKLACLVFVLFDASLQEWPDPRFDRLIIECKSLHCHLTITLSYQTEEPDSQVSVFLAGKLYFARGSNFHSKVGRFNSSKKLVQLNLPQDCSPTGDNPGLLQLVPSKQSVLIDRFIRLAMSFIGARIIGSLFNKKVEVS